MLKNLFGFPISLMAAAVLLNWKNTNSKVAVARVV